MYAMVLVIEILKTWRLIRWWNSFSYLYDILIMVCDGICIFNFKLTPFLFDYLST